MPFNPENNPGNERCKTCRRPLTLANRSGYCTKHRNDPKKQKRAADIQHSPKEDRITKIFSTSQVAEFVGVETWRVRRLFEDGTLAEPQRFAGKRAIPAESIPIIIDALRTRGWLKPVEAATRD
jgi:hypothetical protein